MSNSTGGFRTQYRVEYVYKDGGGYGYDFVYALTAIGAKKKLVRDMDNRVTVTSVSEVKNDG